MEDADRLLAEPLCSAIGAALPLSLRPLSRNSRAQTRIKRCSRVSATATFSHRQSRQAGHSRGKISSTLLQQCPALLLREEECADHSVLEVLSVECSHQQYLLYMVLNRYKYSPLPPK